MELTQIRYFIAVAQCQNMSQAALQLHIAQPSLSKAITKLEAELGFPLFDRHGRRIVLNDEGRRFLKGALAMVRELDDTVFDVREMMQAPVARLTVGITGNNALLTDALMRFAELHPEVRFHLQCNIEEQPNVDINCYDMLVYPKNERYKKFNGDVLCRDPYLLAVAYEHPLYQRIASKPREEFKGVAVDDLVDEEFVFMRYSGDVVETPYELCVGRAIRPRVRVFTNSQDMHRQVIATGRAIGFVAKSSSGSYASDAAICLVPLLDKDFKEDVMVCFKRDKHLSATGKLLRDYMRDLLGNPGVRGSKI